MKKYIKNTLNKIFKKERFFTIKRVLLLLLAAYMLLGFVLEFVYRSDFYIGEQTPARTIMKECTKTLRSDAISKSKTYASVDFSDNVKDILYIGMSEKEFFDVFKQADYFKTVSDREIVAGRKVFLGTGADFRFGYTFSVKVCVVSPIIKNSKVVDLTIKAIQGSAVFL